MRFKDPSLFSTTMQFFPETSTIISGYNWEVRSYVKEGKKDVTNSTDNPFSFHRKMIVKIWGRIAMKLESHFSRLTSVSIPFSNVFLGMDGNTDVSTSYHHYSLFRSSDFLFFLILSSPRSGQIYNKVVIVNKWSCPGCLTKPVKISGHSNMLFLFSLDSKMWVAHPVNDD